MATDRRRPAKVRPDTEYHNKAIYQDFKFFLGMTGSILAGLAYVLRHPAGASASRYLILTAGLIELAGSVLFAFFVYNHQKSKIERWPTRFTDSDFYSWQETGMVCIMIGAACLILFGLVPLLWFSLD